LIPLERFVLAVVCWVGVKFCSLACFSCYSEIWSLQHCCLLQCPAIVGPCDIWSSYLFVK